MSRKFRQITSTVASGLKTAIVEAAGALQGFIDRFRQVEARQTATLQAQLGEAQRNLRSAEEGRDRTPFGDRIFGRQIETSRAEVERLQRVLRDRALEGIRPQLQEFHTPETPTGPTWKPIASGGSGGGGGRDKAAAAAEREAEAVRRLIAELEEELRLVGASSTEKEIANTLRRAGVDAASAEGQQITALVTAIERETAALEENKQAQEARAQAMDSLFQMGSDAMLSMIDNSLSAEDALKRLVVQLALAAAQLALLGSGPLAGLFGGGGLFGLGPVKVGAHHSGGNAGSALKSRSVSPAAFIGAPRFHEGTLGLRPNELAAVLQRGEEVLTASDKARTAGVIGGLTSRVGSGQAAGGAVEVRLGRGLEARIIDQANTNAVRVVQEGISEYDSTMPQRVNSIANDPWLR